MNLSNVATIYRKDLIDAIKDARVLIAIILPFGIALFYNFAFDDDPPLPSATIAYAAVDSEVPERLQQMLGDSLDLEFESHETGDDVQQAIADEDADMGLVIPQGFDEALESGETPTLEVLFPDSPGVPATTLAGAVDLVVRQIADTPVPAVITPQFVETAAGTGPSLLDDLGVRRYFVMAALMMLVAIISIMAVPIILAEEVEKKTLEALTLIASYVDVAIAKALVGITYIGAGTLLLLLLTGEFPADPVIFFSGVMLLAVALVAFGLLIGGLFRSANQLNNWGGLILLPIIAPAFVIGVWSPGVLEYVIEAMPVAQGMKLAVNGMSGDAIFANVWLSYVILIAWALALYSALFARLSRLRG